MIGAEIIALVGLILAAGLGWGTVTAWTKRSRENHAKHEAQLELMYHDMREAVKAKGHEPIDEFVAVWGHLLSKEDRKQMDEIRTDRYNSDNGANK